MQLLSVRRRILFLTALVGVVCLSACTQLKQPDPQPYFAETGAPPKQELRWSNGKTPKTLDPAKAAAAPESDIARALYDGLTDLDPKTLSEVPAIAERWESADDGLTWRFFLRKDAVWSNGEPLTAHDFVRSWKRLKDLGDEAAHRNLLMNIRGMNAANTEAPAASMPEFDPEATPPPLPTPRLSPIETPTPDTAAADATIGVVAESDGVLRVELVHADKDFPKLVAHPVFRPVFREESRSAGQIVTSGPFRLTSLEAGRTILDRSENYWDRGSVTLERVEFVASASPETALEAYRAGEVDAVTNAAFSPAAIKLLEPFDDFRRTTHSAINLYELNTRKAPFSDRRVRQALAISIEREKLTEGELQGANRPANNFLPHGSRLEGRLLFDISRAQNLLDEAGFPDGEGFPVIRLLVNRNDAQLRIARAVAQMWKQNLNIGTEIVTVEPAELERARLAGEFDAIRRGIVMPTVDETVNFLSLFGPSQPTPATGLEPNAAPGSEFRNSNTNSAVPEPNDRTAPPEPPSIPAILTEDEALYELPAIPLYFSTSHSLIKPYVKGFDVNALDSPSLKSVEIDPYWRTR